MSVAVLSPASRKDALSVAVRLEYVTLAWMIVEALGALGAGIVARSVLLVAFGADSVVELASAGLLLWRLRLEAHGRHDDAKIEASERLAGKIGGVLLVALAAYVALEAVWSLFHRESAERSFVGLGIAVVAAIFMPILAKRKLALADQIGSAALRADAMETFTCGFLSRALLVGLALNALLGWWWIDAAASLAIVPFILKEAREALSGHCACSAQTHPAP